MEPFSKDEIKWMSASRRRKKRVGTFKDRRVVVKIVRYIKEVNSVGKKSGLNPFNT